MRCIVLFVFAFAVAADTILSSFKVSETKSVLQPNVPYATQSETFRTSAIALQPGGVVFTDKEKTVLQFPKPSVDEYAITGFKAELVDEAGKSVPLSEVYLHHWLVYRIGHSNLGVCGDPLDYVFGIGAESRMSPIVFPESHGYIATPGDKWTINLHVLRIVGLKTLGSQAAAVKGCIECDYAAGKGCSPTKSGQFGCCMDGSQCPVDGSVSGKKNYFFQYTITYTTEVSAITPLWFYLLDGSNCQVEHNIAQNNLNPVHVTEHSWKAPANFQLVQATGHVHIGGINISLLLNGQEVCTTTPKYGTDASNTPGNEKGYAVQADTCQLNVHNKAGDTITVRSHYWVSSNSDPLNTAVPSGGHNGVMDYMYLAVVKASVTQENGTAVDLSRAHELVHESIDNPEHVRSHVV